MEMLLTYFAKSAGLLIVFFALYYFLLRKDHSFSTNRKFLLGGLFASAILPSVHFTRKVFIEAQTNSFQIMEGDFPVSEVIIQEPVVNPIQILFAIYFTGVVFMTGRMLLQLISLFKVLYSGKITKNGGINYIAVTGKMAPFSFLNFIVYNPGLHSETELLHILKHEKAHVMQWHTADVLLANLNLIYQWFNPFAWLYVKILQQNLEYIADSEAVKEAPCKKEYQKALVRISVKNFNPVLTNSFYQSFIKKRIVMLNRKSTPKNNYWKISLAFPLMLAFIFLFNVKTEAQVRETTLISSNSEVILDFDKNTTREDLNGYVAVMNAYDVILKFENLKYNNDGLLTNIKVEFIDRSNVSSGTVTKSKADGIDPFRYVYNVEEGSRFATPKFHEPVTTARGTKNVRVKAYNPTQKDSAKVILHTITSSTGQDPIYIVDGKVVKLSPSEIDPKNVNSMTVLKGASAVSVYGKEAKGGAIIITTKKHPDSSAYAYSFTTDTLVHMNAYQDVRRLNKASAFNSTVKLSSGNIYISSQDSTAKPLYIIDGKDMGTNYKVSLDDSQTIASINVTKGDEAVKKYGSRGRDGVIEIFTKANQDTFQNGAFAVLKNTMTQTKLSALKNKLKQDYDLDVTFDNIKRNKQGIITAIKIIAKNKSENVELTSNETGGIPDIYIGLSNNKIKIASQPRS